MSKIDFINQFIKAQNAPKSKKRLRASYKAPSATAQLGLGDSVEKKTIIDFLSQLILLNGVPVNYILPHPNLLPDESIRFFTIDMEWINHLLMGALSLGSHTEFDQAIDAMIEEVFKFEANGESYEHIPKNVLEHLIEFLPESEQRPPQMVEFQDSVGNNDAIYAKKLSGFIIKSEFVSLWPGVKVLAKDKSGNARILNSIVIGKDVKLCLFEGHCDQFVFYENTGALSLGFDIENGGLAKKMREKPDSSTNNKEFKINVPYRNNPNDGVLDINGLANRIKDDRGTEDFGSDYFAYYMLQGAENVKFSIKYNS